MSIDSVLKQMKQEYTPNDTDRQRVHAALTATLMASAATGAAYTATGAGAKGAALVKGSLAALPVWIKGAIGVGAVAAAAGGAYGVNEYRTSDPALSPRTAVAAATHVASTLARPPEVQPTPAMLTPMAVLEPSERAESSAARPNLNGETLALRGRTPAATDTAARTGRTTAAQTAGPNVVPSNVELTSLNEIQLIGTASRALREGRSQDAQDALSEHERRYADSTLGQERAGLALLSRCAKATDSAARTAAEAFLRTAPKSPLAGHIKKECLK